MDRLWLLRPPDHPDDHGAKPPNAMGRTLISGLLALISSGIFAGAAFYITVVEQPARLRLDDRAMLLEWQIAYRRGLAIQAPLAAVSFALGSLAWAVSGEVVFLVGAIVMIANWPWTLIAMRRTNKSLMELGKTSDPALPARKLVLKWGRLHFLRTLFGLFATLLFLIGCKH
jgi:anthrone oxygenase-like protein